jgi:hypothetical protein
VIAFPELSKMAESVFSQDFRISEAQQCCMRERIGRTSIDGM